jgi:hypothetical protein
MSIRYRITPEGRGPEPSDQDLLRYRDSGRLLYNYERANQIFRRKPLYKDRKAFIALLIIVFLSIFIAEVVDKERSKELPVDESGRPASEEPRP